MHRAISPTPWCHAALSPVVKTFAWGLLLRDLHGNIICDCLFSFVSDSAVTLGTEPLYPQPEDAPGHFFYGRLIGFRGNQYMKGFSRRIKKPYINDDRYRSRIKFNQTTNSQNNYNVNKSECLKLTGINKNPIFICGQIKINICGHSTLKIIPNEVPIEHDCTSGTEFLRNNNAKSIMQKNNFKRVKKLIPLGYRKLYWY